MHHTIAVSIQLPGWEVRQCGDYTPVEPPAVERTVDGYQCPICQEPIYLQ